jgi:quinol monooxygenase YgiN
MSIPTDENRDLLTAVAVMRAKAGREDDLRAALEELIEPTRKEDGNHSYALHQGTEDPSLFIIYENWTSAEHLDAHLTTSHLQDFLPKIPELVEGELVINRVRRIA